MKSGTRLETKNQPITPLVDEDVYPLHVADQFRGLRWIMSWMMRFNDVLDARKLESSMAKLLDIGDWRKLGGRLRFKNNGDLEIYVPKSFTPEQPAFTFTHNASLAGASIEDHPVARSFPKPTSRPSFQPMPQGTRPFQGPPNCPETIEELCKTGKPLMAIHVTTFSDATLVAIMWPHSLMDAVGQGDLLKNWSLVMAGREAEVAPVLAAQDDVLRKLEDQESQEKRAEFKLGSQRMSKSNLATLYARHLWYRLRGGQLETRMVCISKAVHGALLNEARGQVTSTSKEQGKELFVSDTDVRVAWFVKIIASLEPDSRSMLAVTTLNPRYCLASLRSVKGAFLENMTLLQCTSVPAKLAKGSLGEIALHHRHNLQEQATEEQVLAYLRCLRHEKEAGKELLPLAGDANSRFMFINDLTRIKLIQAVDFGPSVVRMGGGPESRNNPPGTVVSYYYRSLKEEPPKDQPYFIVYGKDHGENIWILGNVNSRTWEKIGEELHRLERECEANGPKTFLLP